MKKTLLLSLSSFLVMISFAQKISKIDYSVLKAKEDSLAPLCLQIWEDSVSDNRYYADSLFTRVLLRTLKVPYSFYYAFDSLRAISIQYPSDSSFRVFTWQLNASSEYIKQRGVIQMNTKDGSMKIHPLFDQSENIENEHDTITGPNAWIGAIYYKIIQNRHQGKNYYTLLGFDENNSLSQKKIMEILHFEKEQPVFGAHLFQYPLDDTTIKYPLNPARFVMAYKKFAGPVFDYEQEYELIIKEHLISESNEPDKVWTLVGDGDYEAFKWEKGKWKYIKKLFDQVTPDGQAPTPDPLRDEKGNIQENKLKPVN